MNKIRNYFIVFIKTCGIYISLFICAVFLLSFEKRVDTPISQNNLEDYATFLNARQVMMYQSYYGSTHYEIIVDDIDEEVIITKTLLLVENFDIKEKRFLYLDIEDNDSLYLIINENNEIYRERNISK